MLQTVDTAGVITFAFNPGEVTLTSGGTATSTLTITVPTMSPSFTSSSIQVVATDVVNKAITSTVTVPLTVNAVFNVYLNPPSTNSKVPENWSMAVGSTANFISHAGGLVVNFNNMDSVVHLIHSTDGFTNGPIEHESITVDYPGSNVIGMPASTDPGKTAGGIYSQTVAAATSQSTAQVYCHDHEGISDARTLNFNVAVATTTPANNPNATFTYINTNVLQSSCVACHNATTMSGGVNLSTYAGVSAVVLAKNASGSALYLSVVPGGDMPQGGTPLSAALVQDIKDWINNGALNN
jgi:hypothetical protein